MGAPDIVWLRRPAHGRPPRRRGRIGSVPTIDQIEQILGPEAQALLEHRCQTIPKESLHLPGPDFVERLHLTSDRPTRVLSSLQSLFNHGRLRGTGYVSILPVDQGIEHSAGASFAPNPMYFTPPPLKTTLHNGVPLSACTRWGTAAARA